MADWKYLCRRFDAQRERLDLEETLRTRLDSAECIQRNWLAYLGGVLKELES